MNWGRLGIAGSFGWVAIAASTVACQPLVNTSSISGSSCVISITTDSGLQVPLNRLSFAAQAFVPLGSGSSSGGSSNTITVSSVSLKLITVTTNSTHVNGTIYVGIESDASTQPGGTPTAPSGGILGGTNNVGALDASTVSLTQPVFYTINLPAPVALTPGTAYWVIAVASYSPGGTSTVNWRGTGSRVYTLGPYSTSSNGINWNAQAGNLDLSIGC